MFRKSTAALIISLLLGGCASYPRAPSMMVLPGTASNFDQFRADEMNCKGYAEQSAGGVSTQQVAENSAVNSAAVGTAVGAAAGALLGAASGHAGTGAAIGAGSGLVLGSAAGSEAYNAGGSRAQNLYDNAYVQCMYARGHQVPVPARVAAVRAAPPVAAVPAYPAPASAGAPPTVSAYPPPGLPPPPGY